VGKNQSGGLESLSGHLAPLRTVVNTAFPGTR